MSTTLRRSAALFALTTDWWVAGAAGWTVGHAVSAFIGLLAA